MKIVNIFFCFTKLHILYYVNAVVCNAVLIYFRSYYLMTMETVPQNSCLYDDVNGEIDRLLMLLDMPYDHTYLIDHTCDTVPGLCRMLLPDSSHCSDVTLILDLVHLLPEVCPCKELFIVLLEQMDTFKDDEIFFALLPPLGVCIHKLPSKKHLSLAAALETLSAHITTLPTPVESSECVLSLPSGSGAVEQSLAKAVGALLDFIFPFTNEVLQLNASRRCQPPVIRQISDITRFLLGLLNEPLSRVNLHRSGEDDGSSEMQCRECAERCVSLLVQLQPDIIKLIADATEHREIIERQRDINMQNRQLASGDLLADEVEELYNLEQPLPSVGLAVLLYLVHGEKICADSIPQVYEHHYLLDFNLHLVQTLLTGHAAAVIHKGIILGLSLFTDVGIKNLDDRMFEHQQMLSLLEAVVAVMTSACVKEVSQSAIQLLRTVLKSFSDTGRSRLLEFLFVSCSNANVQGHAISLLKDEINEALSCREMSSSFLAGNSLKHLLLKVFESVTGGYRSNLLTSLSDRVMAALNLLRYLVIRDPCKENLTGIWDLMVGIEETFLKPLRAGIVLCRTDVNAEIQKLEVNENASTGKQQASSDGHKVVEFSIGDQCMPDVTTDQQKEAMHSALISLDMMESVLCRIEQLVDIQS